jgi:quercetin dioxygenase-like cupin family protein
MNRFAIIAGLAIAVALPLSVAADDQHIALSAGSLQWGPASPALPKGAQMAVLYGDPTKEGQFAYRIKLPAGYKVPAHMHPNDENVTVLSGTAYIGTGGKLDETKGDALKAGSFLHMPKGMHHYAWFTEETIIQSNGIGPTGITYINPADDPRKTN